MSLWRFFGMGFVLLVTSSFVLRSSALAVDLGFAAQDGGQAGGFLDFGASARSLGMGKAHVAVTDDAGATYWNPSGLARVERRDIVTAYSQLFEQTGLGFFSYAQPTIDWGTFGVGVVNLHSGNYQRRDEDRNELGNFSVNQSAFLLSNGFDATDRLSLGVTMKVVREQVDTFTGIGVGADLGTMVRLSPTLQLGVAAHNLIAPEVKLRSAKDRYPLDLRGGFRLQALRRLMIAADVNQTKGRSLKGHLGGEFAVNNLLAFRAGLDESEITAGVGFRFANWGIDYAFGYNDAVPGLSDLGASHRVGFHVQFGKKAAEQEASNRWQNKGQQTLDALRDMMDKPEMPAADQVSREVAAARQVIRRQGFLRPQDLYAAQGYISYFEGDYERSVPSLAEALVLDPTNTRLADHKKKALAQMSEERTRQVVVLEMRRAKEAFNKGEFRACLQSCQRVLSFRPDDVEAKTYLEDARKRVYEPIHREMKIAKLKFERQEYLDAIKSLQRVKEMDPDNQEAADYMGRAIHALERQALVQTQAAPAVPNHPVYEIERDIEKSRAFYSQGLLLYSQGKVQQAAGAWDQAVRYDRDNVLARNARDRAQIELKDKP